MARKSIAFANAGHVEEKDDVFRAHVRYMGPMGQDAHLRGPCRPDLEKAAADLASMRAAAAVFPDDRVRAFQAMHAEARRIQDRAKYAKEIEAATLSRTMSADSESEYEEECLTLEDDPDEWWRDLQDGKPVEVGNHSVASRKQTLTPTEATEELMNTFRPVRESIEELRRLLDLKADPNAPVPPGRITPLSHVVTFAPSKTVDAMRALLLERGARETEEDKRDWTRRQRADLFEPARLQAFYEDSLRSPIRSPSPNVGTVACHTFPSSFPHDPGRSPLESVCCRHGEVRRGSASEKRFRKHLGSVVKSSFVVGGMRASTVLCYFFSHNAT